jgi:hypothetical protein
MVVVLYVPSSSTIEEVDSSDILLFIGSKRDIFLSTEPTLIAPTASLKASSSSPSWGLLVSPREDMREIIYIKLKK